MGGNVRVVILVLAFAGAGLALWVGLGSVRPVQAPQHAPAQPLPQAESPAAEGKGEAPEDSTAEAIAAPAPEQPLARTSAAAESGAASPPVRRHFLKRGTFSITGTVLMPGGAPAGGAAVQAYQWDYLELPAAAWEPPKEIVVLETAEDGTFALEGVAQGGVALIATQAELGAEHRTYLTAWRPHETVTMRLEPRGTISGIVLREGEEPVEGARVFVHRLASLNGSSQGWHEQPARMSITETQADGAFMLSNLPNEAVVLGAKAKGFALTLSGGVEPGASGVRLILTQGASLEGRVTLKATGEPVAGAAVRAAETGMAKDFGEAESAEDGSFVLAGLLPGEYAVAAEHNGLLPAKLPLIVQARAGRPSGIRIELADGAAVSGRVYEAETEKGIQGAGVRWYISGASHMSTPLQTRTGETKTRGDGTYSFTGLPAATIAVGDVELPGYGHASHREQKQISMSPGGEIDGIDFPIALGAYLRGVVVDEDGTPVEGAQITARVQSSPGHEQLFSTSENGGRFVMRGAVAGQEFLLHAASGQRRSEPYGPVSVQDPGVDGIELRLSLDASGSIEGLVVDTRGNPVEGARVMAQGMEDRISQQDMSAADGSFMLASLPPGEYRLEYMYEGDWERRKDKRLTLEEGEARTGLRLELDERPNAAVSGQVVDTDGRGIANARVRGGGSSTLSDETGAFELKDLVEGQNTWISASHRDYSGGEAQQTSAPAHGIEIVLSARAQLAGRVVDSRTREPVTRFEAAWLERRRQEVSGWERQQLILFVNEDGAFYTDAAPSGDVTIYVEAKGYAEAFKQIAAAPGELTDDIEIRMQPANTVEGIVETETGEPVADALIFKGNVPHAWERQHASIARSMGDGAFRVESLDPGDNQLTAYHPLYAHGTGTVANGFVRIVMQSGGILEGVITLNGEPPRRAGLSYNTSHGDEQGAVQGDGAYRMTSVPPGPLTVRAFVEDPLAASGDGAGSWRNMERQAIIEAGKVTQLDFPFEAGSAVVQGLITVNGAPATEGHVTVESINGESRHARVDANGMYEVKRVAEGNAEVRASAHVDGTVLAGEQQISIAEGQVHIVNLDLKPMPSAVGRIANIPDGWTAGVLLVAPEVDIAAVVQNPSVNADSLMDMVERQDTADESGAFRIGNVQPGEYQAIAYALPPGATDPLRQAQYSITTVTIAEGQEEAAFDLAL